MSAKKVATRTVAWRGVRKMIALAVANGKLQPSASKLAVEAYLVQKYPERGELSAGTLGAAMRDLKAEGVLTDQQPTEALKVYEGLLFDGDSLTVTIGQKTWAFTKDEFERVGKMIDNLKHWAK